jgi:hypothetical protein
MLAMRKATLAYKDMTGEIAADALFVDFKIKHECYS